MQLSAYTLERLGGGREVVEATFVGAEDLKPGQRLTIALDETHRFSGRVTKYSVSFGEGRGFTTEVTVFRLSLMFRFKSWLRRKWWNLKWRLFMKKKALGHWLRRSQVEPNAKKDLQRTVVQPPRLASTPRREQSPAPTNRGRMPYPRIDLREVGMWPPPACPVRPTDRSLDS
jgi:hypothetical protein